MDDLCCRWRVAKTYGIPREDVTLESPRARECMRDPCLSNHGARNSGRSMYRPGRASGRQLCCVVITTRQGTSELACDTQHRLCLRNTWCGVTLGDLRHRSRRFARSCELARIKTSKVVWRCVPGNCTVRCCVRHTQSRTPSLHLLVSALALSCNPLGDSPNRS